MPQDPDKINRIKKLKKLIDVGDPAIAEELDKLEEKDQELETRTVLLEETLNFTQNSVVSHDKEITDALSQLREEKLSKDEFDAIKATLKREMGPKGDKGESVIGPPGPPGNDGRTPIKGVDYFDGKTPVAGVDFIIPESIPGKDGSPDTPLQIGEKINTLQEIINPKTIKELPELFKRVERMAKVALPITTTNFYASGALVGRAKNINVVGGSISITGDVANITAGTSVAIGSPISGAIPNRIAYFDPSGNLQVNSNAQFLDTKGRFYFGTNVRIGLLTGDALTTGVDNILIGDNAGKAITDGEANIAIGVNSGKALTGGRDNIFMGDSAGNAVTTGQNNIMLGNAAGALTTDPNYNIFIGALSGNVNTIGGANLFLGVNSGLANTEGSNNLFFGLNAGDTNTTGNQNIAIGYLADVGDVALESAIAIGPYAVAPASNTMVLGQTGTSRLKVGFGSTTASKYTYLQSGAMAADVTLTLPTAQGAASTFLQNDGSGTLAWVTATPAANPAGSDTQVQYNDGGTVFGADSGLVWNKTSKILSIVGSAPEEKLTTTGDSNYTRLDRTTSNTSTRKNQVVVIGSTEALAFTGGNSRKVTLGTAGQYSALLNGVAKVSVSVWIYPNALTPLATIVGLYLRSVSNDAFAGISVQVGNTSGKVSVGGRSVNTDTFRRSTEITITTGAWHHIVGVLDYAADNIDIFVDGSKTSTAAAFANNSWTDSATHNANHKDAVGFGIQEATQEFNGTIDELTFYNIGLAQADVDTIYNAGIGRYAQSSDTGIIGIYHFDEGTGTTTDDGSSSGIDGTLVNSPVWTSSGKVSAANSTGEAQVWKSLDNPNPLEIGVQTYGYNLGKTVLEGFTHHFNINTVSVGNIDSNGNWLIGSDTPSLAPAVFNIIAGTATKAPFKLTSGTNLSTAEAGAFEYDGTQLYFSPSTTRHALIQDNGSRLTSGRVPFATTSGFLIDSANFTYVTNRLSPTYITLAAQTTGAGTGPLKFTSGASLMTTAEAGAMEFSTDAYYVTTTTNAKRRMIVAGTTGRLTAQTTAQASVATYTLGATDASYEVSANVFVTTSSAENFTVTCAYTDEGNNARTITMTFGLVAGLVATTAIAFANGAVPYHGVPLHIRCKASTAITIATTGTFTGATYNVEGIIKQQA